MRETSHFPLSTTILIGSTLADWCLTLIEKTTMYFSQSFLGFAWNPTEPSLIESRCSDNRDDQMGYLVIRCHHHHRRIQHITVSQQMGWQSNTPVHRAGPETNQVSSSIWTPRQHQSPSVLHVTADIWGVHMSGKHYIQVWTQAELPDCFGSVTQPHRSMKEFCELGDGT